MTTVTLPWPPTVNHYWGRRRGGRLFLTAKARAFRDVVALELACTQDGPPDGWVRLDIIAHPPDKRKRDIDNIEKPLLDALEHAGAFENDYQVSDLRIRRRCDGTPRGTVRVEIESDEEA